VVEADPGVNIRVLNSPINLGETLNFEWSTDSGEVGTAYIDIITPDGKIGSSMQSRTPGGRTHSAHYTDPPMAGEYTINIEVYLDSGGPIGGTATFQVSSTEPAHLDLGLQVSTDRSKYSLGDIVYIYVDLQVEASVNLYIQEPFQASAQIIYMGHLSPGRESRSYAIGDFSDAIGTYTVRAEAVNPHNTEWAATEFIVEDSSGGPSAIGAWSLDVSPTIATASPGGTAQYTVYVYGDAGQRIRLWVAQTYTSSFSHNEELAPFTSILTVQIDPNQPSGTFALTILGQNLDSPSEQDSMTVQLNVDSGGQQPPSDGGIGSLFDFTISLSPSSQTVKQGNTAQYQIQLTYSDPSWAGTSVNYQITGLSSGITWTPIDGGLFSLSTSSITQPGTYTFTVIGSAQGVTHQTTGVIIVSTESTTSQATSTTQTTTSQTQVIGDFIILPSPIEHTINQGDTATYSLTIDKSGEFTDPVALTRITGEPTGSTSDLTIKDGAPRFTSILTIEVSDSTQPGTYTITVEASGGGKIHTATLTLIVNENTQLTSSSTTTSNTQESKTSESNSLDLLSDPTNLLLIITILILAIVLITILARRNRGSRSAPARIHAPTRYCAECGKPSKTGDPFCSSCGKRLD
jgi:hypothetical protein